MPAKGKTNNPNGRPKGTPNRVTASTREFLDNLIKMNYERITADLATLDPYQRLCMLEKFMSYCVPKMTYMDIQANIDRLSEDQIDDLLTRIIDAQK